MLGLLLIYWIGRAFYNLARRHNKTEWGFAFAGLGVYYGSQIVIGLILYIFTDLVGDSTYNSIGINLIGIGLAALSTYLFYQYLESNWSKAPVKQSNPDILDDII